MARKVKLKGQVLIPAKDGITRITRGETFQTVGGDTEQHKMITEVCKEFESNAKRDRRSIEEMSSREYFDRVAQAIDKALG